QTADVVQRAVVRLADQAVDRADGVVPRLCDRPPHERIERDTDTERVGEHDRRLDGAELVDLRGSRELAERVANEHRTRTFLAERVAAVRPDGGAAGAHSAALDDRGVPDEPAADVRDGVQRAGLSGAWADPQLARARTLLT